jgi:hypothetical protein
VADLAVAVRPRVVRRVVAWRAVPAGLGIGALAGVAARAWMRVVSSEPEFTWSGTSFVIGLFAFVGLLQGVAVAVRRRGWTWWHQQPVRVVAACGGVMLGTGAGIVMLPALIGGTLASARTDWPARARTIPAAIAAINALAMWWALGGSLPVWRAAAGWLAMLALYAVVIAGLARNLRPLAGGPHPSGRTSRIVLAVGGALVAGFVGLAVLGV